MQKRIRVKKVPYGEGTLFTSPLFSADFLAKIRKIFPQRLPEVLFLLINFGCESLSTAEHNADAWLKKGLLIEAEKQIYPPDYTGDNKMTEAINEIIENLKQLIQDIKRNNARK